MILDQGIPEENTVISFSELSISILVYIKGGGWKIKYSFGGIPLFDSFDMDTKTEKRG